MYNCGMMAQSARDCRMKGKGKGKRKAGGKDQKKKEAQKVEASMDGPEDKRRDGAIKEHVGDVDGSDTKWGNVNPVSAASMRSKRSRDVQKETKTSEEWGLSETSRSGMMKTKAPAAVKLMKIDTTDAVEFGRSNVMDAANFVKDSTMDATRFVKTGSMNMVKLMRSEVTEKKFAQDEVMDATRFMETHSTDAVKVMENDATHAVKVMEIDVRDLGKVMRAEMTATPISSTCRDSSRLLQVRTSSLSTPLPTASSPTSPDSRPFSGFGCMHSRCALNIRSCVLLLQFS